MADSVTPSSETPKQPVEQTPAAAAAPPASTSQAAPTSQTPAAQAAPTTEKPIVPDAAAQAVADKAIADKAAADKAAADAAAAKPADDPAAKAVADKAVADKAAADAAAAAAAKVIPETYEIKPIEGLQLDPEVIPAMAPAFKKAGLTQEAAQDLVNQFMQFQKDIPQRMLARDLAQLTKDPDLGGLKYGQTLKQVNLALDAFGDPDFKKFVASAGIANRLEFVRVFQRIGEAMDKAGDTPSRGQPDAGATTTVAQRLYGRTTKP